MRECFELSWTHGFFQHLSYSSTDEKQQLRLAEAFFMFTLTGKRFTDHVRSLPISFGKSQTTRTNHRSQKAKEKPWTYLGKIVFVPLFLPFFSMKSTGQHGCFAASEAKENEAVVAAFLAEASNAEALVKGARGIQENGQSGRCF